jgi:anaerobic selenocysteine-containing dehydrogenase
MDRPVPQMLLLDGANPVFTSPKGWRMREALDKIPYIASFGSFLDETAALSDLILPDHSFLETWSEALPESGSMIAVASVAPAAMMPMYQTRATPDVLLDVGRSLAKPLNLPWENFEALLTETISALPTTSTFDTWTDAQEKGGWWGTLPAALATTAAAPAQTKPFAFSEPQFDGDAAQYPMHFLPYASSAFLDGSLAHLPWLQEMPDPLTSAMWSSWVEINTATAAKLGIRDGDIVEVASAHGMLRTAAIVSPGIAPDVVAMPVGQGHQRFHALCHRTRREPDRAPRAINRTGDRQLRMGRYACSYHARRRSRRTAGSVRWRLSRGAGQGAVTREGQKTLRSGRS